MAHFRTFHFKVIIVRQVYILALIVLNLFSGSLRGQEAKTLSAADSLAKLANLPLFKSQETLEFTITVNKSALINDRGTDPKYHSGKLEVADSSGQLVSLPVKLRSRGHFRKSKTICKYPPILLNLEGKQKSAKTVFAGQNKLKLVMPCNTEELVEREYLIYQVYNLVTPFSLRARLVKFLLIDSADQAKKETIYGFLLETPEQAAARNGLKPANKNGLNPETLMPSDFLLMAVFQYFIGNTDWSVQYLHNIELAAPFKGAPPLPIAYDFDHAGLVNAPYALPAPELELESVKDRRFRGYCLDSMDPLSPVFELFNSKRKAIETLYQDDKILSESFRKWALDYIENFYQVINQPKRAKVDFLYPCKPGGTGTVIIRGLKD